MNIEQVKQVLEGAGVKRGNLGSVIVDCDGDAIEYTDEYAVHNLNDFATILAQHEELERLRDAINKINDAGTHGGCENAITEAVALAEKIESSPKQVGEHEVELKKCVEDALYGEVFDDCGNRDDNGLIRIMPNNWAVKMLKEKIKEQSK